VKDMYMLMNNLLATSQTYLTLQEHVFKKKFKNTTTLTEQGQTCASTHTRLYVFFRQFAVMKSYLKAAVPSRVCVGWSKEFVCDRLHLSFGQSQAVSAVH